MSRARRQGVYPRHVLFPNTRCKRLSLSPPTLESPRGSPQQRESRRPCYILSQLAAAAVARRCCQCTSWERERASRPRGKGESKRERAARFFVHSERAHSQSFTLTLLYTQRWHRDTHTHTHGDQLISEWVCRLRVANPLPAAPLVRASFPSHTPYLYLPLSPPRKRARSADSAAAAALVNCQSRRVGQRTSTWWCGFHHTHTHTVNL